MVFLNYLYFAILTLIAFTFVSGRSYTTKSIFNKDVRIRLNGPEAFWILTFSTGLIALSVDNVINLMAIRLFVIEALCFICLFRTQQSTVFSIPVGLYFLYIAWMIIGLSYSPSYNYGIREILKYLFPFLVVLCASAVVKEEEVYFKAIYGAVTIGIISLIFEFIPFIGKLLPGFWWYGTGVAVNYISLSVICLTLSYFTKSRTKFAIFTILFILPCFIWVFRTSIMGTFAAVSAFYFIKYQIKSLPIIFSLFIVGAVLVFTIPSLHEKMFKKESKRTLADLQNNKISDEDISTNGREIIWEHLTSTLYKNNKLSGSGTGAVQQELYTTIVAGGVNAAHGDYVQILCDNGIIGLVMYISIYVFIFLHCFFLFLRTTQVPIKMASLMAGASIVGVATTLYSENVVNYSMCTLSMPFGLYGMLLGLLSRKE